MPLFLVQDDLRAIVGRLALDVEHQIGVQRRAELVLVASDRIHRHVDRPGHAIAVERKLCRARLLAYDRLARDRENARVGALERAVRDGVGRRRSDRQRGRTGEGHALVVLDRVVFRGCVLGVALLADEDIVGDGIALGGVVEQHRIRTAGIDDLVARDGVLRRAVEMDATAAAVDEIVVLCRTVRRAEEHNRVAVVAIVGSSAVLKRVALHGCARLGPLEVEAGKRRILDGVVLDGEQAALEPDGIEVATAV